MAYLLPPFSGHEEPDPGLRTSGYACDLKSPPAMAVALAAIETVAKSPATDEVGNLVIALNSREVFIPELKSSIFLQNSSGPGGSRAQRVIDLSCWDAESGFHSQGDEPGEVF